MPTIQIRIDTKTKKDAKKILASLGLDLSSAIKLFLRQVIKEEALPFSIGGKPNSKQASGCITPEPQVSVTLTASEAITLLANRKK